MAYTQGTEIHVAPGQERHLPHEAWHVIQQAQGRVQPTMHLKDRVPVNNEEGLEHEADVMGVKATTKKRPEPFGLLQAKSIAEEAKASHRRETTEQQRLVTQAPGLITASNMSQAVIQCDVGFEYETNADTYLATVPLTLPQRQNPNMPPPVGGIPQHGRH